MAKSKKADSKKDEPVEDIPEELAEDIQDAVSVEDEPSKALRTKQIPVTHWQEDPIDDDETDEVTIEVSAKVEDEPIDDETTDEDEKEIEEDVQVASAVDADDADDEDVSDETETTDEKASEEEDHAWHLIEDDAEASGEEASKLQEEDDEEDIERPEWDEETWKSQQSEDETDDVERPEWDEETWRAANLDEEEIERPEWDDEKWKAAQQSEETVDEAPVETETAEAKSDVATKADAAEETEQAEVEKSESKDAKEEAESAKTAESSKKTDEPEDEESLSASQVAINQDDEQKTAKRWSPKAIFAGLVSWWGRGRVRNSMAAAMAVLALLIITVPTPRYAVLNTVGVRASASLSVIDSETQLPLRQVAVELAGQTAQTNENGQATFDDVKLGTQQLTITKSAYDTYTESVTIGVGDNSLEPVGLVAIGTSFEFEIRDWLTGEPINGAEVVYLSNAAFADSEGVAKLNTPDATEESITVTAKAPGYADREVDIVTTVSGRTQVDLVVDRYHLFVSKRDGQYDIYKTRPDGTGEERILEATGNERDDIRFDVSPSGDKAILAASRDLGIKNEDGYVLSGLYLIDTKNGEIEKIDSSERIDIVGWIGDTVIYVKIQAGASGRNPERHRLISYDTKSETLNQIAASNYFNDVLVAGDYIFYAPSDAYKQNPMAFLFRSSADGSSIDTVFEGTVWTVIRSGLNEIQFDSEQVWYNGKIDQIFNTEAETRPTNFTSRLYTENPSGSKAAWVDTRDGQGTLIIVDTESEEETVLTAQGGLRNPITWLSDTHLIYRVVTSSETADYVININGGEAQKITNVTNVSGADRWYYYY